MLIVWTFKKNESHLRQNGTLKEYETFDRQLLSKFCLMSTDIYEKSHFKKRFALLELRKSHRQLELFLELN